MYTILGPLVFAPAIEIDRAKFSEAVADTSLATKSPCRTCTEM